MKKIFVLVILTSVSIAFLYHFTKEKKASRLVEEKTTQKISRPRQSLKDTKYIVSSNPKDLSSFPTECDSYLRDLSALTAEEYKDFGSSKESFLSFFGEECTSKLSSNKMFLGIAKQSQCHLLSGKKSKEGACLSMLSLLKAFFIAEQAVDKKLEDLSSQELAALVAKMLFSLDDLNKEKFLENLKLLDFFQEMHPHDPDVLEATVGYLMVGKQITNESSVQERIEKLLEESRGVSFRVDRLHVIKNVLNNRLDLAKKNLDQLQHLYPKEAELAYYQAAYHWKQGDRAMASTYLEQAIQLSDKNCTYCAPGLYAETKRRLRKAKDKEDKIFSFSIGLNFENL